jgi:serine/threonine-protein kinase
MGEPLRLVHRDVSPHNVLVGVDGISRITDFGIARAEARMTSTKDGQVKGKLAYMAPEQTTSGTVDRRVDLFATGVVLWESLAGKRLFAGQTDGEVLRSLLVNPIPRVREIVPDLPEALDQVCAKALERDADARYATAAQMADALETAGGSIGIASNRAVSQFLREACGDRINAMQLRVRGVAAQDAGGSAVRAVKRREHTDPERTTQRDEADLISAARPGSTRIPSAVEPAAKGEATSRKSRAPAVFGVVGLLVLVAGASAFAMFGSNGLAQLARRAVASQRGEPDAPPETPRAHSRETEPTPNAEEHAPDAADAATNEATAEVPAPHATSPTTVATENGSDTTQATNASPTTAVTHTHTHHHSSSNHAPRNAETAPTAPNPGTFNPESM